MGNLTLRPKWYSAASWPALVGVTVAVIVAFVIPNYGILGVAGILVVAWVISMYGTTIEVTPTDVGVRLWFFGRRTAQRDPIHAMHWYSSSITFVDTQKNVLERIATWGWTGSQVLEISEALGVPLYDHRTGRGWGNDVKAGHLVTRASQSQ